RNSSASVTTGGSDPAASGNRPAVNSAVRPNPTGRVGQAAHCAAAQSNPVGWSKGPTPVSAGWFNPAARPYFRPSSVYFNNMYWPELYDPMYMNEGRWGTAVKTTAGYSWRKKRPHFWRSKSNSGSHQSTWYVKDILTKFDMESVRTATTPYEAAKTKLKDETDPLVNVHLYRSMIGLLMYLTASRPDIMFAVSACSGHQVTPLTSHLECSQEDFQKPSMLLPLAAVDRYSGFKTSCWIMDSTS
ncbi:hypothetical protein Tco_0069146, partial [Tanacetum coccineum]